MKSKLFILPFLIIIVIYFLPDKPRGQTYKDKELTYMSVSSKTFFNLFRDFILIKKREPKNLDEFYSFSKESGFKEFINEDIKGNNSKTYVGKKLKILKINNPFENPNEIIKTDPQTLTIGYYTKKINNSILIAIYSIDSYGKLFIYPGKKIVSYEDTFIITNE
jgi:hypothetical protein